MRRDRAWIPFGVLAALVAAALFVSGLRGSPIRVFALGAPNANPVAVLTPGSAPMCEGPIRVSAPIGRVRVWAAAQGTGAVQVSVLEPQLPGSGPVDVGHLSVSPTPDPYTVSLSRPLRPDGPLTVCLSHASLRTAVYGSDPADPAVTIRTGTKILPSEFALVLLSPGRPSFWDSLGTIVDRASLFRFAWVGPWTIWLLGVTLLVAVFATGVAISRAAAEDADGSEKSEGVDEPGSKV